APTEIRQKPPSGFSLTSLELFMVFIFLAEKYTGIRIPEEAAGRISGNTSPVEPQKNVVDRERKMGYGDITCLVTVGSTASWERWPFQSITSLGSGKQRLSVVAFFMPSCC